MNPESSEIEPLLKTPATLPLRKTAAPQTPVEVPQNAVDAPQNAVDAPDEVNANSASLGAAFDAAENAAPVARPEQNAPQPEATPQAEAESQATLQAEHAAAASPLALRFSPAPDAPFQSSMTLDVLCDSPTAQIHYALGAASVDEHGMLFNSKDKIFLTTTTLVAARAFENGVAGPLLSAKFEVQKPQWQELEPQDQSDATPHQNGEARACPDGWHLAAGSVRGKLHAHRALWREDSFELADIEAGSGVWSVVAVSDGAGSAPLSRVGSRLACAAALDSLRVDLGEIKELSGEQEALVANDLPVLREALVRSGAAALDAIRAEAQTRGKPLTAFASTLLVLARREWNDAQLCAALQVGDGAIALLDDNGLTLLGEADHGQHSSETRFLTTGGVEADLATRVKFSIKNDLLALAVMSDGVSDDYFPEDKRLREVFDAVLPLVQHDDAGASLVDWLGYEKKGSSDDRTLVVGWPAAPLQTEVVQAPHMSTHAPSLHAPSLQTEARDGETEAADGHAG